MFCAVRLASVIFCLRLSATFLAAGVDMYCVFLFFYGEFVDKMENMTDACVYLRILTSVEKSVQVMETFEEVIPMVAIMGQFSIVSFCGVCGKSTFIFANMRYGTFG